jgi:hypothetical protein
MRAPSKHLPEYKTMNDNQIGAPVAKLLTVWAAIGITSWADAASFLAFCYSLLLIGEWFWKRLIKPSLVDNRER